MPHTYSFSFNGPKEGERDWTYRHSISTQEIMLAGGVSPQQAHDLQRACGDLDGHMAMPPNARLQSRLCGLAMKLEMLLLMASGPQSRLTDICSFLNLLDQELEWLTTLNRAALEVGGKRVALSDNQAMAEVLAAFNVRRDDVENYEANLARALQAPARPAFHSRPW